MLLLEDVFLTDPLQPLPAASVLKRFVQSPDALQHIGRQGAGLCAQVIPERSAALGDDQRLEYAHGDIPVSYTHLTLPPT